jgi:hypothetical protein
MAAFQPVELSVNQAKIDKIGDRLEAGATKTSLAFDNLNAFYTANSAMINTAANALASAVNLDVKSIESTMTTFSETSAVLMKGLDALGQVHPFVGGTCFFIRIPLQALILD